MGTKGGPLLLEGHGLMMCDGRVALCLEAYAPINYNHEGWSYKLFDEGETIIINNDDVKDELSSGGRVIIMDM